MENEDEEENVEWETTAPEARWKGSYNGLRWNTHAIGPQMSCLQRTCIRLSVHSTLCVSTCVCCCCWATQLDCFILSTLVWLCQPNANQGPMHTHNGPSSSNSSRPLRRSHFQETNSTDDCFSMICPPIDRAPVSSVEIGHAKLLSCVSESVALRNANNTQLNSLEEHCRCSPTTNF